MGTDESLLAKFNKHHSLNNYYEKPPTKEPCFSVIHYAGVVKYNIKVRRRILLLIFYHGTSSGRVDHGDLTV